MGKGVFPEGKQILILDEPAASEALGSLLRTLGARPTLVSRLSSALEILSREEFDMAMVGVHLGGESSRDLLSRLKVGSRIPSVLMLARPDEVSRAIRALGEGADDYILKPPDRSEVRARVGRILRWQDFSDRAVHLQREMSRRYLLGNLVTRSRGMARVREQILQVAAARSTVLIRGESGVGKELVAKAIHYNSKRRAAPFIAINCSAIPVTLIESELFGHERGSFTGATERRKGKFELAHGGTIFLDEIGDMDLQTQSKLLRVLEEREFMRIGGGRQIRVDVRVLAATNSDLDALIVQGRFREDLYFRLHVVTIGVPPLRDRREDMPDLARICLEQVCRDNGLPPKRLTEEAVQAFMRYSWPGNVRELKNVLESTAITKPGEWVRFADLPAHLREARRPQAIGSLRRASATLEEVERELLVRTLVQHGGNRTHSARALRVGVRTLQRKIKAYGIDVPSVRRRPRRRSVSADT